MCDVKIEDNATDQMVDDTAEECVDAAWDICEPGIRSLIETLPSDFEVLDERLGRPATAKEKCRLSLTMTRLIQNRLSY